MNLFGIFLVLAGLPDGDGSVGGGLGALKLDFAGATLGAGLGGAGAEGAGACLGGSGALVAGATAADVGAAAAALFSYQ